MSFQLLSLAGHGIVPKELGASMRADCSVSQRAWSGARLGIIPSFCRILKEESYMALAKNANFKRRRSESEFWLCHLTAVGI